MLKPVQALGLNDEITAYKAQYGFDPSSLPNFYGKRDDINAEFIANIKDTHGDYVYPDIHDAWAKFEDEEAKRRKGKNP
jgi:hypothetical protein